MSKCRKRSKKEKRKKKKKEKEYKREVGILNRHLTWVELKPLLVPLRCITHPVQLDACTMVSDVGKMVDVHSSFLDANSGTRLFLPYYERLLKLYYICLEQNLIK